MSLCGFFVIVLLTGYVPGTDADSTTESKDCKFWHQLAYNLSHIGDIQGPQFLRLACNSTCSSITCSGNVNKVSLPVQMDVDLDFCFGVRLNHCDNPVDMDYYLYVPNGPSNFTKTGSITHNDTFEFPAVTRGTRVSMVVLVEMVRVNASYIMFGITGKVKWTLAGIEEFPYTEQVFPPTLIDVPPCVTAPSSKPAFNPPQTCVAPPPSIHTTAAPGKTTGKAVIKSATLKPGGTTNSSVTHTPSVTQANKTKTKPATNTTMKPVGTTNSSVTHTPSVTQANIKTKPATNNTYNKTCEFGVETCGPSEMCRASTNSRARTGICVCNTDAHFDGTAGFCKPNKPTQPSTIKPGGTTNSSVTHTPSVTQANTKTKPATNMTPVIIGAVFGGLLLIVVVVSVIIFIGRRRRLAVLRGQHQLLMDNDDDDDRNMVI